MIAGQDGRELVADSGSSSDMPWLAVRPAPRVSS